jgi:hypothetical protein
VYYRKKNVIPDPAITLPPLDWPSLRGRFKQRQEETGGVYQNWQIRVHRSLSWLKRAGEPSEEELDLRFILHWIALNALYSRWDPERNAPAQDSFSRTRFLHRVCDMDPPMIARLLKEQRSRVKKILENWYLSDVFWKDPATPGNKGRAAADANYLDRNLKNHEHCKVLQQVMDRLYVLRGQLMHGAATGGGKLNRQTLRYSLALMEVLVPLLIWIVIEHGCDDDWPELCYPPLS